MRLCLTGFLCLFIFAFSPTAVLASVKVPILMYHFIANNPNPSDKARDTLSVSPDRFEQQMEYLSKNGYTPIDLNRLFGIFSGQSLAPSKPVVLTFDDGYQDFYTIVYPILRKYNFTAVSFIPTGLIGGGYYMSWPQIKEIHNSGLVDFEAHAVTHANLLKLNSERIKQELVDSKNALQSQLSKPINFIAYPYGASNDLVRRLAQEVGFVGGLGTWYGKASVNSTNMPRIRITGGMSLSDFAKRL